MPVLGVGVRLDAVAADVEPDGRIEGRPLVQQEVDQFVVESGGVFSRAEISAGDTPVANGLGDAADELAHAGLALGGAQLAVEIFAGHDISSGHGPVLGDLHVRLLEDDAAGGVGDLRGTLLPLHRLIRRGARLGEETAEGQAGGVAPGRASLRNLRRSQASNLVGNVSHSVSSCQLSVTYVQADSAYWNPGTNSGLKTGRKRRGRAESFFDVAGIIRDLRRRVGRSLGFRRDLRLPQPGSDLGGSRQPVQQGNINSFALGAVGNHGVTDKATPRLQPRTQPT